MPSIKFCPAATASITEQPAHILTDADSGNAAPVGQMANASPSASLPLPVHEIIVRFGHVMFRARNVLFPLTLVLLVVLGRSSLSD